MLAWIAIGGLHFSGDFTDSLPAQESREQVPVIATEADLYAAFPPGEWLRIERAVDKGLFWLAEQQFEDGSFPTNKAGQPAVTSMAIMAFLSRGHLPGQGKYGDHIDKAIDYVLAQQHPQGYFSDRPIRPPTGHLTPPQTLIYNHTISGLMLGEVYGMTTGERSVQIQTAMSKALAYSRMIQTRKKKTAEEVGGWRYAFPDSPETGSDISVTGWALMFYRSARNAEFEVPKQYFDEGLNFVENCFVTEVEERSRGTFRYRPLTAQPDANPTLANTGSAVLTLILGGRYETDLIRISKLWYMNRQFPAANKDGHYYLSCYYSSQAMAQLGGDAWMQVYPQIVESLLSAQYSNGSWPPGNGNEKSFGSTYATSLAILALTPPYQLLPIYQR